MGSVAWLPSLTSLFVSSPKQSERNPRQLLQDEPSSAQDP